MLIKALIVFQLVPIICLTAHAFESHDTSHHTCPHGFFRCKNGECVSPRWRCDGHYDCDDYSDEMNCSPNIELPSSEIHLPSSSPAPIPIPHQLDSSDIKIASAQEPLMLFSTGTTIRGFWVLSRIYLDIFSKSYSRTASHIERPSITQALSIFFDIMDRPSLPSSASSRSGATEASAPPPAEVAARARSTIVGIDLDPNSQEVYWVELGKSAGVFSTPIDAERAGHDFDAPKIRTIVSSGLLAPEDVALDLAGQNIYITDAGIPAIVVCSIKHSHCRALVRDNLHKPRAIIVNSATGWLIYTDWGDHPGIFLVSMDGSARETLIDSDVVWPNGLAADHLTNQLYWADARLSKIERVDLKTHKRQIVVKESAGNPFSLSVFENRLYWSDWSGSEVRSCDKLTGNGTRILMRADNIYGIHMYHPNLTSNKALEVNPCWSKHCSHMCLLKPVSSHFSDRREGAITASCACPESMRLDVDGTTCYERQPAYTKCNPHRWGCEHEHEHEHESSECSGESGDERNCSTPKATQPAAVVAPVAPASPPPMRSCPAFMLRCPTENICIHTVELCDGHRDCEDGFDERNCSAPKPASPAPQRSCPTHMIRCPSENICIHTVELCDGHRDCEDGFDERNCSAHHACASYEVSCDRLRVAAPAHQRLAAAGSDARANQSDTAAGHCIPRNWLCDGTDDCGDGSDEASEHCHHTASPTVDGAKHEPAACHEGGPCPGSAPKEAGAHFASLAAPLLLHEPAASVPVHYASAADALSARQPAEHHEDDSRRMVWLVVLLLMLSLTGLITLVSLLVLHRQGRLPRDVSKLSVSFKTHHDKDGPMLLLDNDA